MDSGWWMTKLRYETCFFVCTVCVTFVSLFDPPLCFSSLSTSSLTHYRDSEDKSVSHSNVQCTHDTQVFYLCLWCQPLKIKTSLLVKIKKQKMSSHALWCSCPVTFLTHIHLCSMFIHSYFQLGHIIFLLLPQHKVPLCPSLLTPAEGPTIHPLSWCSQASLSMCNFSADTCGSWLLVEGAL